MVYGDSLVVISQINKEWDCSSDSMGKYCSAIRKLEDKFEGLEFHHVERDRNTAADVLSKLGSSRTQVPPGVFVQEILQPSISMDQAEECNIVNQPESDSDDWRRPIIRYIKNEEEPDDKNAAERIARLSAHYTLMEALRKKVFDKNEKFTGKWIRELPYVVWSLRTQPSRALHGNTPFFMVYGSEAVLPADLKFGAPRLIFESIAEAEATRREDIDILEEERLNAVIQSARYQQTLRRYHDKAVRQRSFSVGDIVLRRILTGEGRHKLSPLWEGSFIVAEVTRPGSYRLTQMDDTEIGNSWNIEHLRKFYP
jgi:hypothetical protein